MQWQWLVVTDRNSDNQSELVEITGREVQNIIYVTGSSNTADVL